MNGVVVKTSYGSRYFLSNDSSIKKANIEKAMQAMGSAKPGATIMLTRQERERQTKAAEEALKSAKPRATISLFGITLGGEEEEPVPVKSSATATATTKAPAVKNAPRGVPTISKWRKNRDGSVTGSITGSPRFSEGEKITTSPIASGDIASGNVVKTGSGSRYFLS